MSATPNDHDHSGSPAISRQSPSATSQMQVDECTPSALDIDNTSYLVNDGRFPDDVKLTLFSESASMQDLAIFAKTNRNARQLVPYAINMRFLALLCHYFTAEGGVIVRDFMRSHGIAIAGSEGHRFARGHRKLVKPEEKEGELDEPEEGELDEPEEEEWEPNNIDFFTPKDVGDAFVALLVSLGASYYHPEDVATAAERNNHAFRKATKSITHLILRGKKIVVHESTGRRAAVAVLDSWTSCMAMVTADYVVVFYPKYFFQDTAILQGLEEMFTGTEPLVAKYAKRGVKHVEPFLSKIKSYCLADWATIGESSKVCVLPMHAGRWGTTPPEFAGCFRWRATIHCYDYDCAVHNRGGRRKSLMEELRELNEQT